ncbi:hypothetical protein ACFQH6_17515 [Halobacteriaceae archaeon GCM10025711]
MLRRVLPAVVVVLVVTTAGCAYVPESETAEVDYRGTIEYANGTFHMDGEVYTYPGTHPPSNYSDVRVTLYDANQSVIRSVPLGSMSIRGQAPKTRSVNITTSTRPQYVVIESPDFWPDSALAVTAYTWNDALDKYSIYYIETPDQKFNSK